MQLPLNNEIYFLLLSVREIKLVPVILDLVYGYEGVYVWQEFKFCINFHCH